MKIHRDVHDRSGMPLAGLYGDDQDRHALQDIVVVPVDIDLTNDRVLQLEKNVWRPIVDRRESGVLLVQSQGEEKTIAGLVDVLSRLRDGSLPLGGSDPR